MLKQVTKAISTLHVPAHSPNQQDEQEVKTSRNTSIVQTTRAAHRSQNAVSSNNGTAKSEMVPI